jgi:hypothetical protein
VLALGKDSKAYLLNRDNLGGMGGSLLAETVTEGPIRTAPATWRSGDAALVAFQGAGASCPRGSNGSGLTVLRITSGARPGIGTAWCASVDGRGAPIVTTTDGTTDPIVWITGAEGDNQLHGFRGDTGQVAFDGGGADGKMPGLQHFGTILATAGRLYVAGSDRVYAFRFGSEAE